MPGSEGGAKMSDQKINKELSEKIENYDKSNLEKVEAKEGLPEGVKRDMTLAGEDMQFYQYEWANFFHDNLLRTEVRLQWTF